MFQIFKKGKGKSKHEKIKLLDLDGQQLSVGDTVRSLRYDLGVCRVLNDEKGFLYESLETNQQVSWVKMVDATTKYQKVLKISQ